MVTTTIIGLAFLGHAVAVTILALTQPTSTFAAVQHRSACPPTLSVCQPVLLPQPPAGPPVRRHHGTMRRPARPAVLTHAP
jgi:hypothetical protein